MRSRAAFSLTEVLFAALILALAMIPTILLFPTGARRTAFGEAQLRAHLRAETLLVQSIDMAIRTGFRNLPEGAEVTAAGGLAGHESVRFDAVAKTGSVRRMRFVGASGPSLVGVPLS